MSIDKHGDKNKLVKQNTGSLRENELGGSDIDLYNYESIDLFNFPGVRDYWDILVRRKWLIIICVMISLSITFIYTLMTTPEYKATAVIEILPGTHKITSFKKESEFDVNVPYNIQKFYETQYKLIKSRSLAKNVVDKLGLVNAMNKQEKKKDDLSLITFAESAIADLTPFFGFETKGSNDKQIPDADNHGLPRQNKELEKQAAVSNFLGHIQVSAERKSRLAEVSYIGTNPKSAANYVNSLVDEYSVWMVERRHESTRAARDFLDKQLEKSKAKLEKSEEELAGFSKKVDVVSLDKDLNLIYKQLSNLNEAYADAETTRISKESLYDQVKKGNYSDIPQIVNNEAIQELNNQLTELQSQYNKMSTVYGPNYPDMKQLKAQIKSVRSDINSKKKSIVESIKKDYEAALAKEQMLGKRTEVQNQRASKLNDKTIQYNILKRQVDTNQSIYDSLLQRYKETEIASAVRTSPINVVDYASVPTMPFKPSWPFNTATGLLFGLLAGGLLAYGAEYFDNAIKDEDEVKEDFPLTYLGAIPYLSNNENMIEKIVDSNPRSIMAESYRIIRTSLFYSSPSSSLKTILVSSSQPLEGKSTTASNLAIAVTKSDKTAVLVDCDMRRPRIQRIYMGSKKVVGLSSFLINKVGVDDIIYKTDIDNLHIIPGGIIPPNPAELIGSGVMVELLKQLSERYDYVFIDAPPLIGFADSRLLSTYVDGLILVTSVGVTQKRILKDVIRELDQLDVNIIGAVVNRLNPSRDRYSYYYHYYTDERGHALKKDIKIRPPGP